MKNRTKKTPKATKDPNRYPRGWNRQRVQELVNHYENQTDDEAVDEDEAAFNDPGQAVVLVPTELLTKVNKLLAAHAARK